MNTKKRFVSGAFPVSVPSKVKKAKPPPLKLSSVVWRAVKKVEEADRKNSK